MNFIKKQGLGFYLCLISLVLGAAGLVYYNINCHTAYFTNLGVSPIVVGCTIAALILQAGILLLSQKGSNVVVDLAFVASSVLLVVALANFLTARVNGIASIMTFENNASTMADLSSAITGMVLYLLAVILGIVASYCKVCKD